MQNQLLGDMSPWGMFWHATPIVKLVMVALIALSIWTWGIFIEKSLTMRAVSRDAMAFLKKFRKARSLEGALTGANDSAMAHMLRAGMQEVQLSTEEGLTVTPELRERVKERVHNVVALVEAEESERLMGSMSILASIGSTSPFIGLFGTVWGIMHSFIGIAETHSSSLAVVAPGIAEALMTTAFGLAAAIPAVMIYNKFSRDIARFTARLDSFSGEFAAVLSRQLDKTVKP